MKATDFTLKWIQDYDYNGRPFTFSKVDASLGSQITKSMFGDLQNYTAAELANVMIVLSDALWGYNTSDNVYVRQLDDGEIVYLSTLFGYLSSSTYEFYFAFDRLRIAPGFPLVTSNENGINKLAGTFYIFDFNPVPRHL